MGDILKVRNGYAFKSTDYQPEGVPLIRQSDLGDDVVDITGAKRVDARFVSELPGFIVRDGDLLIGMSGSLGKIARYQHSEPALQNQRTGLLLVKPEHEPKFAKLVLKFVEPQILAEGKGIAVQNVSAKEIEDCTFPLPDPDEQRRIVAEIEKQFTRLEAGVAALRRVQANLKRYRAAVLKAACEGRLVPTEAGLHRQLKTKSSKLETGAQLLARILTERRQNWQGRGQYKESAAPEPPTDVELPEGWTWATMPQLGELNRGKSKHRPRDAAQLYNGPYPFIQTGDIRRSGGTIREHTQTYSEFGLQQSRLWPEGTLCITIAANIAETGILKFKSCFPDSVVGFTHDGNPATTRYVEFFIRTAKEKLAQFAPATAQKNINLDVLQKVAIPLPPLVEQTRIVAEVERRLSVVEELESVVTANLQRATRLRQSILQKAFTGQI